MVISLLIEYLGSKKIKDTFMVDSEDTLGIVDYMRWGEKTDKIILTDNHG